MKTLAELFQFLLVCGLIILATIIGIAEGESRHTNDYAAGFQAAQLLCPSTSSPRKTLWQSLFEAVP